MSSDDLLFSQLIRKLISMARDETELLEFKSNIYDEEKLGKTVSAMANSAALAKQRQAYIIFGIEDKTLRIIGTQFNPYTATVKSKKQGAKSNQLLLPWLQHALNPQVALSFHCFHYAPLSDEQAASVPLVLLEIPAASFMPVSFQSIRYVRNGAANAALEHVPDREARLWAQLSQKSFLRLHARSHLSAEQVGQLLDLQTFAKDRRVPPGLSATELLQRMEQEQLLEPEFGMYSITNLGALLYAFDLTAFEGLENRIIRVAQYKGTTRAESCIEERFCRGYALEFFDLLAHLMSLLPNGELVHPGGARQMYVAVPEIAVREILANCMIHQDMTARSSTLISVFKDRIEFISPGTPDIDVERFIDSYSTSRNEQLAAYMNRLHMCESRGEGIDKAVIGVEEVHSVAPLIDMLNNATRVVLPFNRPYDEMSATEKLACCVSHCTLCYVNNRPMTNSSLRERLGLPAGKTQNVSQLIRMTMQHGLIKPAQSGSAKKSRSYVPSWVTVIDRVPSGD